METPKQPSDEFRWDWKATENVNDQIRYRDQCTADVWFEGEPNFTAQAVRDRRDLLAKRDELQLQVETLVKDINELKGMPGEAGQLVKRAMVLRYERNEARAELKKVREEVIKTQSEYWNNMFINWLETAAGLVKDEALAVTYREIAAAWAKGPVVVK